jgi:hypothetical protein
MQLGVNVRCFHSGLLTALHLQRTFEFEVKVELQHGSGRLLGTGTTSENPIELTVDVKDDQGNQKITLCVQIEPGKSAVNIPVELSLAKNDKSIFDSNFVVVAEAKPLQDGTILKGEAAVDFIPGLRRIKPIIDAGVITLSGLGAVAIYVLDTPPVKNAQNKYPLDVFLDNMLGAYSGNIAIKLMAITLIISIFAAFVERVMEVMVASFRKPYREVIEMRIKDAERRFRANRKREDAMDALFMVETQLVNYKNTTRLFILNFGFFLGCLVAAGADIKLLQLMVTSSGNGGLVEFSNIVLVGLLVAGGAEPLHKLIKGVTGIAKKMYKAN